MVSEKDVEHIGELADIGIDAAELATFTGQFNAIVEYFDVLDKVHGDDAGPRELYNILREDEVEPSLPRDVTLGNAGDSEDGFIKAPRVM